MELFAVGEGGVERLCVLVRFLCLLPFFFRRRRPESGELLAQQGRQNEPAPVPQFGFGGHLLVGEFQEQRQKPSEGKARGGEGVFGVFFPGSTKQFYSQSSSVWKIIIPSE